MFYACPAWFYLGWVLGPRAVLAATSCSSGTCIIQAVDEMHGLTQMVGDPKRQRSPHSQEGLPGTIRGVGAAVALVLLSCTLPSLHWLRGSSVPAPLPVPRCVACSATEPWDGSFSLLLIDIPGLRLTCLARFIVPNL